jgi:hypothetical protein
MPTRLRKPGQFVLNGGSWQAQGLAAWWPLVAGGQVLDLAGNYNGTMTGNVAITASYDGGYAFRSQGGTGDYADFGDVGLLESQTVLSVCVWATIPVLTDFAAFLGKQTSATSDTSFSMGGAGNGSSASVNAFIRNGANSSASTSTAVVSANVPFFACYTYDGGGSLNADRLQIYFNGKPQTLNFALTIPASTVNNAASMRLGWVNTLSSIPGFIHELRVYRRHLKAPEVAAMAEPSGRYDLFYVPNRKAFCYTATLPFAGFLPVPQPTALNPKAIPDAPPPPQSRTEPAHLFTGAGTAIPFLPFLPTKVVTFPAPLVKQPNLVPPHGVFFSGGVPPLPPGGLQRNKGKPYLNRVPEVQGENPSVTLARLARAMDALSGMWNSLVREGQLVQTPTAGSPTGADGYKVRSAAHIAISNPGAFDDSDSDFPVGALWVNSTTAKAFLCVSNTPGAASWAPLN